MSYFLSEQDPEYSEEGDNILTERRYLFTKRWGETIDEDENYEEIDNFGIENHCYLFHDLYDHEYDPGMERISLKDMLRIGSVWVDVEVVPQMWMKIGQQITMKGKTPADYLDKLGLLDQSH